MATRRDSKHRVLRRGESIRPDGKYQMQPKSEMACACLWLYTEVSRCCVIMKGSDQT